MKNGSGQLPQGNLGLLDTDIARRLLVSTIPARMAYCAADGTPRVNSTWFQWTGEALVMPTFISAPHVRPASRIRDQRDRPDSPPGAVVRYDRLYSSIGRAAPAS